VSHDQLAENLTVQEFPLILMKTLLRSSILGAALAAIIQVYPHAGAANHKTLEVFSWWTSGSEAAALHVLFRMYREHNHGVEIINAAVTGGGGSAALPVLQTRLAEGNPPDSWQTHPGYELLARYVALGACDPVTDLYESEGWDKVVPKSLIDEVTKGGDMYAVLVGVHRGNVLWYNKKVLEKNQIKIDGPLTFDQFFAAAEKLKAAGIVPLAVGDSGIWATAEIFENTLLGVLGPQGWKDLFSGKLAFDDPKVKQAAQLYGKLLDYQNPDHSALTWDGAVRAVIQGSAAFTSMGDWTYGEMIKAGLKENQDFGWVDHPGTQGSFIVVADGFTLGKGAPDAAEATAWLRLIGSKQAQEAFDPVKGAIPARTDVDKSKFGAYLQWSMASFAKDNLVPSCVHGEAAPSAFQQAMNDSISLFVADKDVDHLTAALVQAAKDYGIQK
jgi:glucose/mannose transport system substrate-binding protein